ncbi:hypothetical protein D3C73_1408410 [compost metagenome]
MVGEAVPGRFLLDEYLQVEIPSLIAVQQAHRHRVEIVGLEPVIQVSAAAPAKAALGPVG